MLSHGFYFGPLARVMIQQSRMLRSAGEPQKAVELLLDLALFGGDLSRNAFGYIEGTASEIRKWALDELRICVVDRSLPRAGLETLDRELRILEEATPDRSTILSNNTALLGEVLLANRDSWIAQPGFSPQALDWRHAYSKGLLALDLFTHADDWNRRAGAAASRTWPEAVKIHQAIRSEGDALNDLLSFQALAAYSWSGWTRAHLAKTRLLRVAVRYRLSGELLSLDDPFGDRLRTEVSPKGRLQVWSVGEYAIGEPAGGPWSNGKEDNNFLWVQVER
jgi:hypothetical protein